MAISRVLVFLLGVATLGGVLVGAGGSAKARQPTRPFALTLGEASARLKKGTLTIRTGWRGTPGKGTVTVRLLDLGDRTLARAVRRLTARRPPRTLQFALQVTAAHQRQLDLLRVGYVVRVGRGKTARVVSRGVIALSEIADMPFLWLQGQDTLIAGSKAALRVVVRDVKERVLAGVRVSLKMTCRSRTGAASGRTDRAGSLQLVVKVPRVCAGRRARLSVTARTDAFSRTRRETVTVKRQVQALLATDKPIYQPGQTVHLRLLALHQPSRQPLARARVRFEAVDRAGNRLARIHGRTDDLGVAWTRVRLSDAVAPGALTLKARVWVDARHVVDHEVVVRIFRYRVPTFRVTVTPDRTYYRPGARLRATVEARYLYGKPVPGARVKVVVQPWGRHRIQNGGHGIVKAWEYTPTARISGKTNHRGQLEINTTVFRKYHHTLLSEGGAALRLKVEVTGRAGRRLTRTVSVPVSVHGIVLGVIPEAGKLLDDIPQRLYLVATHPDGTPAPSRIKVAHRALSGDGKLGAKKIRVLRTDALGIAVMTITTQADWLRLRLSAIGGKGQRGSRALVLGSQGGTVLVRPDRAIYRAGDTVRLKVLSSIKTGIVYLDVKRRDQTVMTATGRIRGGRAKLAVSLPRDLDGLLVLTARVGSAKQSGWTEAWAPIVVRPRRRLFIRMTADRRQYRPGQRARLQIRVTDEQGRGRRAAVGLTVVDQGVYLLAGRRPGGEEVPFVLEQGARADGVTINGWTPLRLLRQSVGAKHRRLAGALMSLLRANGFRPAEDGLVYKGSDAFPAYQKTVKLRLQRRLKRYFQAKASAIAVAQRKAWRLRYRKKKLCPREQPPADSVADLIAAGHLARSVGTDLWGQQITLEEDTAGSAYYRTRFYLTSTGPDASADTELDLKAGPFWIYVPRSVWYRSCPKRGGGFGLGGRGFGVGKYRSRSPRAFMSTAGRRRPALFAPQRAAGAQPRIRRTFRETVAVLPALRTDAAGRATVRLRLADNITTWVASAVANTAQGRLGSSVTRLKTFKPFFVEVHLPPMLTRLDEVEVPVVVHNHQRKAAIVRVQLQGSAWIQPVKRAQLGLRLVPGPAGPRLLSSLGAKRVGSQLLMVPAEGIVTTRFRVRALLVGRGSVTVKAVSAGRSDAVLRSTLVAPEGVPMARGVSGLLQGAKTHTFTVPSSVVQDSQKLTVTVEPSLVAASLGSVDDLVQRPVGCFEQSSAITFPNILALRHLRVRRGRRAGKNRALRFVREGYQKLLTYRVSSGGFSAYGGSTAEVRATAMGLAMLTEMARVRYVDPRVIAGTRRFLMKRQNKDGSWAPDSSLRRAGRAHRYRRFIATAYLTWMLARGGVPSKRLRRATSYLRGRHGRYTRNAYAMGLTANALIATRQTANRSVLRKIMTVLGKLRHQTAKGNVYWAAPSSASTVFYGYGMGARQETTALAILALARTPGMARKVLVTRAVRYLLAARKASGAWSTTQATVLALKALLTARVFRSTRHPRRLRVYVDGKAGGEIDLKADGRRAVHRLILGGKLVAGRHIVRLVPVGGGTALYRVQLSYHRRGSPPQRPSSKAPRLQVTYSRKRLTTRQTTLVRVRVDNPTGDSLVAPMVELGLPPGFDLLQHELEGLRSSGKIDRYEQQPLKLVLYFNRLPKGATRFSLRLRPRFALKARIPPSVLYEYYRPERRALTSVQTIEVCNPASRGCYLPTGLRRK